VTNEVRKFVEKSKEEQDKTMNRDEGSYQLSDVDDNLFAVATPAANGNSIGEMSANKDEYAYLYGRLLLTITRVPATTRKQWFL